MSALPVAVPRRTAERLQWLVPAPLWSTDQVGPAASGLVEPWIAEMASDQFVAEFLDILSGSSGRTPAELGGTRPDATADGQTPATSTAPYRLFQPLSQRYYLVAATLVCRRPGIPDHQIDTGAGDRVFFVMRRLDPVTTAEQGFVPGRGGGTWQPANAVAVLPGEEEHPMHPAAVAAFAAAGTAPARLGLAAGEEPTRTVFFGYIPVAGRDALVPAIADPGQALRDLQQSMPLPNPPEDPALDELIGRVVEPWDRLVNVTTTPSAPDPGYPSLFIVLDLLDWLGTQLETVRDAVLSGGSLPAASAGQALLDGIRGVTVKTTGPVGTVTLAAALQAVAPYLALIRGDDVAGPSRGYDLRTSALPGGWLGPLTQAGSLAQLAGAALRAAGTTAVVPPELRGLIKADPVTGTGPGSGTNTAYVIRTVLVHEPCQPVLSAPTHAFELARALDADAPARQILLQLPEITHLRKFKRGVAIEMSPKLRQMMDRVTPDLLKGDGLGPPNGLQLGMICSFSLQIIFLVAFIVMFIFLILLNLVFWWLPFLKICFPIPVRPSAPNGPTP